MSYVEVMRITFVIFQDRNVVEFFLPKKKSTGAVSSCGRFQWGARDLVVSVMRSRLVRGGISNELSDDI